MLFRSNVFQASVDAGVGRIIFASSIQVLGTGLKYGGGEEPLPPAYLPLDGEGPANTQNAYPLSKGGSGPMPSYFSRLAGGSGRQRGGVGSGGRVGEGWEEPGGMSLRKVVRFS